MVTKSPAMALPSAPIVRLNPNWASSWGLPFTATRAKSSSSSARKKVAGSRPKSLGCSGVRVGQNVMVGQQEAGGHQGPGAEPGYPARVIPDVDAPYRAGGAGPR